MISLVTRLLNIKSPTFEEQEAQAFIKEYLSDVPFDKVLEEKDSLIFVCPFRENKKHICFVGHTDVVPSHFKAYIEDGQLHGSGSSDMKSAVAVFMYLLKHHPEIQEKYNISFIAYTREEGTSLQDNGLYSLIETFPEYFESLDLAIVGEPTNNTIQIGCVGSIHCHVKISGKAAHSARPWNGENALYKAIPFIQGIENIKAKKKSLFGVDFFDVIEITESQSDTGRTTIPENWTCNINYRFAPTQSLEEAEDTLKQTLLELGLEEGQFHIYDAVFPGAVIESELFKEVTKNLDAPIEAKQAWTDVAQLTKYGIPSFNFGPGLTDQAHKPNEYILISDIENYIEKLLKI
jgi:succinyl-diaminopimelate desuccinylase